jgi:HSP20 family protein
MADIVVRRTPASLQPSTPRDYEPLRMLRDLVRWDPFQEMAPIWPIDARNASFPVAFEVKETKDAFQFRADVPGVKEQDIDVTLTGSRLSVSGKRDEEKEEEGDNYYTCERTYGNFTRLFTLPEGVDAQHVQAELRNGVLSISIPKMPAFQPKKIAVKATDKTVKV